MNSSNRNLLTRIVSAALLIPGLLALILWQRSEPFAILIHVAVVIGLVEFFCITLKSDPLWMRLCGVALGLFVSLTLYWCPHREASLAAISLSFLGVAILYLFHFGDLTTATARASLMVFGILYLTLSLTPLALLKRRADGSAWIFLVLSITWFSDTGAYFSGRALGKHKLYPAISPGKSVEGAIGGIVSSVLAAILAKSWYLPQLDIIDVVILSLVGGALAQIGDLVESMIKRSYQVKDSGWIIPGHGGLLDRIDALLFSAPFICGYATFFVRF